VRRTRDGEYDASGFSAHPSSSFGYLLRQTSRRLDRAITQGLATFGLTVSQYHLLRELWDSEGQTVRDLANRVNVAEPSTLRTISLLEERGVVSIRTDRDDQRKRRVFLTAVGRRLQAPVLAEIARVCEFAYQDVSREDMQAALRVFDAIGNALDTVAEDQAS
jgi:DNA-binding MarR family transcriptional regulator